MRSKVYGDRLPQFNRGAEPPELPLTADPYACRRIAVKEQIVDGGIAGRLSPEAAHGLLAALELLHA